MSFPFAFIYHLEYVGIRNLLSNFSLWISMVSSSPTWNGWTWDVVWVIGGKQTFKCSGAKSTVQMFLDSCQPDTYLQEKIRNNLTCSFQSTIFKGLEDGPHGHIWHYSISQDCFLLGLYYESDLGISIIYLIMRAVYWVRFVFFL